MRKILLYFALKYNGDYKEIYQAIKEHEQVSQNDLKDVESKIKSKYVTIVDNDYPACLKTIGTPPFVIFYYGDFSIINSNNKLAVIGNRAHSVYGQEITSKIIKESKKYNPVIVSGLALGIDSIAHQAALDNNIKTIAVLGGGIDNCYPICNKLLYNQIKKDGLVISEYPNDLPPQPKNFLIRNRIIAAISDKILVTESKYKSGTMNTVAYGLDFGKEIFAVPNLANVQSGCNYLIKQGATLVECAKDIFE